MTAAKDRGDILRGAMALLGGFGGRLLARLLLLLSAGHLYGATSVGFLGELAALIEILTACATLGLKRSLLDRLNYAAQRGQPTGEPVATALVLSTGLAGVYAVVLCLLWPYVFSLDLPIVVFIAIPAAAFADVALTATRFCRVIRWEVLARCIAEPWGFLGMALIFYAMDMKADGLPMAYAVSLMTAAAIAFWGLCRSFGTRQVFGWRPNISHVPAMLLHSLPVGFNEIGMILLRRVDILLLGLFVDQRITGLYYMAQQITTIPHRIYRLFEPMVGPVIASLYHTRNIAAIGSKLVRLCRWIFILQLGITVPLMIFADNVLGFFGSQFSAAMLVLVILLAADLVDGSFSLAEMPLVFARPVIMPPLIITALAVESVSILLLAPLWGAAGAALGFLCTAMTLAAGRLLLLEKTLAISILDRQYVMPLVVASGVGLALWVARQYLPPHLSMPTMAVLLFAVMAFQFTVSLLLASKEDRHLFKELRPR